MNIVNQMLLTAIMGCILFIFLGAMAEPTLFGQWLQTIDNARFEYMLCE